MTIREFDKWVEENKKDLETENYEFLYRAWIAGYNAGRDSMSNIATELSWYTNPDRSGGQFTSEEINRSNKGGESW